MNKVNFDVGKNRPKLIGYHSEGSLDYCKNYASFIIPIHASTKAEMLVKIGSVVVEIFSEIGRFLPYRVKKVQIFHTSISGVTGQINRLLMMLN